MKIVFVCFFLTAFVGASFAQEIYLLVNSGGGVAGTTTSYKITPDGKVLKGKGLGEIKYVEESKLGKCSSKKIFKDARAVVVSSPDFNHPGNLYSSITLHEQGKETRITWGDTSHVTPEDAKKLYQKINAKLTKLTFTSNGRK